MDAPSRLTWPELNVPEGTETPSGESVIDIANFLVSQMCARAPASLEAEYKNGGPALWILKEKDFQPIEIFRCTDLGRFRSVLARFGQHYLDTQLYGGFVQRVLIHSGARWMCRIYMSNAGGSGFWIRAYAMHLVQ